MNGREVDVNPSRDKSPLQIYRGRWEGVTNVVRFNWPLYAVGLIAASAAIAGAALIPRPAWLIAALWAAGIAAAYLLIASLLVSVWVYDLSPLYRFAWAREALATAPKRILNLHSGFDESSAALQTAFSDARIDVLDFYDVQTMTEPSIARARRFQDMRRPAKLTAITKSVPVVALPIEDGCIDAAFVILAAHEIRAPDDRARFFNELARVLRRGGRSIVVEHLRNASNFLAFGPQFVHFYSRSTWLEVARNAGLSLIRESRITPFVGLFVFEKPQPTSP
jgi:ubiquinone/menaquinone biosynthesis C-methylase UbiE